MKMRTLCSALFVSAMLLLPLRTFAADLTVGNGVGGATVTFAASGGNLTITLTNGSTNDPFTASGILTGVFFDIAGDPTLTKVSARLCDTCSVGGEYQPDPGGGVGGEWAYKSNAAGLLWGLDYGVSAAALGVFGTKDLFGGTNLSGPAGPGGIDYGITTKFDSPDNDANGLSGFPVISNQVIFTLAGLDPKFDPTLAISNVTFHYGAGTDPLTTPEPTSLALLGIGAATTWVARRRRKSAA